MLFVVRLSEQGQVCSQDSIMVSVPIIPFFAVYTVDFHFKMLESFSSALHLLYPGTEKNVKISNTC